MAAKALIDFGILNLPLQVENGYAHDCLYASIPNQSCQIFAPRPGLEPGTNSLHVIHHYWRRGLYHHRVSVRGASCRELRNYFLPE